MSNSGRLYADNDKNIYCECSRFTLTDWLTTFRVNNANQPHVKGALRRDGSTRYAQFFISKIM